MKILQQTLRICMCAFLLGFSGTARLHAQIINDIAVDSLISLYGAAHNSPVLFMHFDKNVYSNNENVWFTGYLLGDADSTPYKTLSLALVKNDDRRILMDDRFVISNGFCFGNTVVPDSVGAGAYTFVAYSNRLENKVPDVLFTQQITIKTESQQTFNASLSPLDTAANAASQKVILQVNFSNEKSPPTSVPVSYYIGNALNPSTSGAVKTAAGQYVFNIPSAQLSAGNNKLHVQVKYKNEVQDISFALPVPPQPVQVNFFPESGNIVSGTVNTVGWEAKSAEGAPINVRAVLYEDKQAIETLTTNDNGMGRFMLIPDKNKKYYLQTLGSNGKTYDLPAVVNSPTIKVSKAVVNDTLLVDVHNDNPSRKLYLIGHNYKQAFFLTTIEKRVGQRVKIVLNNIPRGILQLTLADSLGRPYAERMVFAHYTNPSNLVIAADNSTYSKRNKVKLNIKLGGEAAGAAVSVAVVQESRLEMKNKENIESYFLLENALSNIPVKENHFSNSELDKRDLENILLIRGWSRYKWTDVLKVKAGNAEHNSTELVLGGRVTKNIGKVKQAITVVTFGPTGMYETDVNGAFVLPDSNIVTEPGKKISIMVANDNPSDFNIGLINPYDSINKQVANLINPVVYHSKAQENSADLHLAANESAIRLNEVVIKDKKIDDDFHGSFFTGASGANACGDYVCQYNILNCPNHRNSPLNTQPKEGVAYQNVIYHGCQIDQQKRKSAVKFKGIYAAQEFYPSDYSEISPSQPEYISTLYWKNQLLLEKGKPQEVSFYTSDITGVFKVIVQGVTDNDVLYSETSFRVTK